MINYEQKIIEEFRKIWGSWDAKKSTKGLDFVIEQFLLSALSGQKQVIAESFEKYKCDFNWDFEKNKKKHKSYIALEKALEIVKSA